MKQERKIYKLGELGRVVTGKTPAMCNPVYFGDKYPFITPSDMKGQKYARTERSLSDEGALHLKSCLVPPNSVSVSCIGWQMGKSIMTDKPSITNQQLNTIVPNDKIFPDFLYYSLSLRREELLSLGAGTGVRTPILNKTAFSELSISLPPLETQRKIASILSAYDDLIENNTRRIKVLEEMARMIYREWFVDFRFPGHKKVQMVDSPLGLIPEGWEVGKLQDYIELCYGKALKAEDRQAGPYPVYGSSGVVGFHSESLAASPGVIVGRKGNVGSVRWTDEPFFPIDTVYYVKTDVSLYYVFYNLQQQNFINNDAAVPGLNRNQAYSLPFILPSEPQLKAFDEFIGPVFKAVRSLTKKNQNLRQTRDLLLPKLISGEVNLRVSDRYEEEKL